MKVDCVFTYIGGQDSKNEEEGECVGHSSLGVLHSVLYDLQNLGKKSQWWSGFVHNSHDGLFFGAGGFLFHHWCKNEIHRAVALALALIHPATNQTSTLYIAGQGYK